MITAILLAATLSPFDQVVAAERAFAAASLEKGLHEAFLKNIAKDSVTFRPVPTPARELHEGQPPARGSLSWGPEWVAVSSAGDLALSTGPWIFRPPDDSTLTPTTGCFISVWRKQVDGVWKVAVDAGISSRLTFAMPTTVENGLAGAPAVTPQTNTAAEARAGIKAAESVVAANATTGLGTAVVKWADPLMRVYREREAAGIGPAAAHALLAKDTRRATCTAERIESSTSGDLGYSYGTCVATSEDKEEKSGFLHVWRRQTDGAWRILVDVTSQQ